MDDAIECANQIIELRPDSYEGYYARSKVNYENCDLGSALQDINAALQRSQSAPPDVLRVLSKFHENIFAQINTNENSPLLDQQSEL